MGGWIVAVREGRFVTRDRVRGYGVVLFLFELAVFLFCVAGTHGWVVPLEQPVSSDFVSFYAAGSLVDEGSPALAYDQAAHHAAEQRATEPGIAYNFFFYPPVFLLLCGVLARLPYLVAFVLFQVGSVVPCVLLARRIVGAAPALTIVAFPAVFWTVGTGQNAGLTGALFAGAILAIERRPVLAGVLLGSLCYKPQLGLLVPVALVAGRHWRVAVWAAVWAAVLVVVSGAVLGWPVWGAFVAAASGAGGVYGGGDPSIDLAGMTSPYGLILALGGGSAGAGAVQAVVLVALAAVVAWVWAGSVPLAGRAAVLLAATPVAVPIGQFYDLMLTGLAVAWIARDGMVRGFPPWQRSGLALLFALPLLSGNTGFATQIGIPPAAAALGLCLALRQALARRFVVGGAVAPRVAAFASG